MVDLANLTRTVGNAKRRGRGIGSKKGKTSGRGTKGQKARAGFHMHRAFEGGQTPLVQRLPKKRGFKSRQPKYALLTLEDLEQSKKKSFALKDLYTTFNLPADLRIKLLANGELTHTVTVEVHAASKSAKSAVVAAGGQVSLVE